MKTVLMLILVSCLGFVETNAQCRQELFIEGNGIIRDTYFDVNNGRLERKKPVGLATQNGFLVNHCKYYIDWKVIEKNYKQFNIMTRLVVKDEQLFFDSERVTMPHGEKMRKIWQAVLWRGWIICLGRTSRTDHAASLAPPFLNTELIMFSIKKKLATIDFIDPFPPMGTRLFILDSQQL